MKALFLKRLAALLAVLACVSNGSGQESKTPEPESLRSLRVRAEKKGDIDAQFSLGLMYYDGQEVAQDYSEAARWFRKAADQGYATAQFNLCFMYFDGNGMAKDSVLAHMWCNLAALYADSEDKKEYAEARDWIAKQMPAQQIAEAQRRARDWKCCSPAFVQSSGAATLRDVRTVYVDYLGSAEGAEWIREKVINRIVKSGKISLAETPESADATLTGIGTVRQNARGGYDATLVARLVGKNSQILWVGEAKPRQPIVSIGNVSIGSVSASSSVADKVVNDLLKAIEKDAKTKR